MDTMMTATPFRAEEITINCRVNPSWIRISILTLITIGMMFWNRKLIVADEKKSNGQQD